MENELHFSAEFGTEISALEHQPFLEGFNEHGVRVNKTQEGEIESVDAIWEAMEPGEPSKRNGVRITLEFLKSVSEKDYSGREPFMLAHSRDPLAQVGYVPHVWFSDRREKLMLMTRTPNTGATAKEDVIAEMTYDPPQLTDGSVSFQHQFTMEINDDGEPELVDGKLTEFSITPFPGGYDEGGLAAAFAEEATELAQEYAEQVDDEADGGTSYEEEASETPAPTSTETITF